MRPKIAAYRVIRAYGDSASSASPLVGRGFGAGGWASEAIALWTVRGSWSSCLDIRPWWAYATDSAFDPLLLPVSLGVTADYS
jgi:hypothetical protein